jgi:hypothetical protein
MKSGDGSLSAITIAQVSRTRGELTVPGGCSQDQLKATGGAGLTILLCRE